ncbi:MAG: ribonuclease HII [Parachlamydiales bacterium]|nr:ribonuclease HII [Parachlamydiales bacterium]
MDIDASEYHRLYEMSSIERKLYRSGYHQIAGVDEAGRGPLAGPVVAAAIIMPPKMMISGIDDSKKVSKKKREAIFQQIISLNIPYAVGIVDSGEIDRINILQATFVAMQQAVAKLFSPPDFLLIDGHISPPFSFPLQCIVHGDSLSISIAAASIIAKITRDEIMEKYDTVYPEYGFCDHKGYGTAKHLEAIKKYGPSPIHRFSFAPIKEALL